MKKILYILFFALTSCQTVKVSQQNIEVQRIEFGSGGGFLGKSVTYELQENGTLRLDGDSIKSLNKEQVLDLFKKAGNLGESYEHPGNLYYFIRVYKNDDVKKYVWGEKCPNKDIWNFYIKLSQLYEKNR